MKKLIIASLIVGSIYLASNLSTKLTALENIKASVKRVTNISIKSGNIVLKLDLNLTNLSNYNLGVNTFKLASLKRLRFFNAQNRLLIGEANVNIHNITLPSNETIVLTDIIAQIPLKNTLSHINLFTSGPENISVVPLFDVAGKEMEINPENFV
jgi:Flp pilus assembly protein CpaB